MAGCALAIVAGLRTFAGQVDGAFTEVGEQLSCWIEGRDGCGGGIAAASVPEGVAVAGDLSALAAELVPPLLKGFDLTGLTPDQIAEAAAALRDGKTQSQVALRIGAMRAANSEMKGFEVSQAGDGAGTLLAEKRALEAEFDAGMAELARIQHMRDSPDTFLLQDEANPESLVLYTTDPENRKWAVIPGEEFPDRIELEDGEVRAGIMISPGDPRAEERRSHRDRLLRKRLIQLEERRHAFETQTLAAPEGSGEVVSTTNGRTVRVERSGGVYVDGVRVGGGQIETGRHGVTIKIEGVGAAPKEFGDGGQ